MYIPDDYKAYQTFLMVNKNIKKEKIPYSQGLKMVKGVGLSIAFIENPTATVRKAAIKENIFSLFFINTPTDNEVIQAICSLCNSYSQHQFLCELATKPELFTECVCIEMIMAEAEWLKYIPNPSNKIIGIHLEKYGDTVKYLDNPNKKIIKACIKGNRYIFNDLDEKYTSDPELIEYAIKNKTDFCSSHLKTFTDDQLKRIISYDPSSIFYMNNPIIDHILLAAKRANAIDDTDTISDILNLVENLELNDIYTLMKYLKKTKILNHKNMIGLIKVYKKHVYSNPIIEKIQIMGIDIDYDHFLDIWNDGIRTTDDVKLAFLMKNRNNARSIIDFVNVGEKVQLAVINRWPDLIDHIENPTIVVQYAVVNKNPILVNKIHFDVLDPEVEIFARLKM